MKKILSVFLLIVTLISAVLPSAASNPDKVDITKSDVSDDLYLWDENYNINYPVNVNDTDIYILHMQEYGYTPNGRAEDYALYFYIYNPSMKTLVYSDYNQIQLASAWENYTPTKYTKYGYLSVVNASDDDRFIKIKFDASKWKSNTFFCNNPDGSRSYTISGIELRSEYNEANSSNTGDYTVGYTFTFSGYSSSNNLSCKRSDITVIELQVNQTSYLTGDSAKETHQLENGLYSNQINSVYFSIPNEYEKRFGNLYAIDYEYYKYRTAPIILIDNQNDFENLDIYLNQNLSQMSGFDYKFYDKLYEDPYVGQIQFGYYWGTKKTTLLPGTYVYNQYPEVGTYQDYYTALLKRDNLKDRNNFFISAYELQLYFAQYAVKMGGNETVNRSGKYIGSNNYWGDLFDLDYFDKNYIRAEVDIDQEFSLSSLADTLPTGVNGFLKTLRKYGLDVAFNKDKYDNSLDNVKYIEKVQKSDIPSDDLTASSKFLIHATDIPEFREFTEDSQKNNSNVYLLHYAISDDYYFLALDSEGLEGNVAMCQETVYLDFDIITLSFKNNKGSVTVIPVVSAPTDGFTGIENILPPPFGDSDGDGEVDDGFIRKLIAILLVALGIYLVIQLIKLVGSAITSLLNSAQNAKLRKDISKNMNNDFVEINQDNLFKKSWKQKIKEANERRRSNLMDYRQRRKEKLEYDVAVAKSKQAKAESKALRREAKYKADFLKEENKYSRSERRRIDRESRARTRSINRASKRRNRNYRSPRRSRSYGRNNRYRY